MERLKVIKKINNLSKVKGIVEIAKVNALSKISHSNKIKNHHYKMAEISKDIINFSQKVKFKDQVKTKKKNAKGILWIYITIPHKLLKISYSKYNRILEKNIDTKSDAVIAVGDSSIEFTKSKNYNMIAHFNEINNSSNNVASIIMGKLVSNEYSSVKVISHNNKNQSSQEFINLFPFEKTDYDKEKMSKMKFYYSLSDNIQQISFNYIKNMIFAIYQETYRNFYIEKLAKHESSLKTINSKVVQLKMNQSKEERKLETEEMIQVIQSVKRS